MVVEDEPKKVTQSKRSKRSKSQDDSLAQIAKNTNEPTKKQKSEAIGDPPSELIKRIKDAKFVREITRD